MLNRYLLIFYFDFLIFSLHVSKSDTNCFKKKRQIQMKVIVKNLSLDLAFFVALDNGNIYSTNFSYDNCFTFPPNCTFVKILPNVCDAASVSEVPIAVPDERWITLKRKGFSLRMERRVDQYYSHHLALLNIQ